MRRLPHGPIGELDELVGLELVFRGLELLRRVVELRFLELQLVYGKLFLVVLELQLVVGVELQLLFQLALFFVVLELQLERLDGANLPPTARATSRYPGRARAPKARS